MYTVMLMKGTWKRGTRGIYWVGVVEGVGWRQQQAKWREENGG